MPSYMIRRIDPALLTRCREQAQAEGVPLSQMMVTLLERGLSPAKALGARTSDAKAAASRENGRLGGRPRKEESQ